MNNELASDLFVFLFKSMSSEQLNNFLINAKYKKIILNRESAYVTYLMRSKFHESNTILYNQFKHLLNKLKVASDIDIVIHGLFINENLLFFFTNLSTSEIFGVLEFKPNVVVVTDDIV